MVIRSGEVVFLPYVLSEAFTRQEREAVWNLRSDNSIIILPANKDRMTVIMNKTDHNLLTYNGKQLDTKRNFRKTRLLRASGPLFDNLLRVRWSVLSTTQRSSIIWLHCWNHNTDIRTNSFTLTQPKDLDQIRRRYFYHQENWTLKNDQQTQQYIRLHQVHDGDWARHQTGLFGRPRHTKPIR